MHKINFFIKLLAPLVISSASNATLMTKSHDEISGSMIHGIFANRYIKENKLGNKAHEDKTFRELFYGGLKFLSATPVIFESRSFVLPQSLQRGKKGTDDEKNVQDLLSVEKTPAGYKSLRGYGIVDGDKIFTASVKKNIFMHMSRSESAERISGKSEEGHIYNYEAIDSGQKFHGVIIGTKVDLEKLNLTGKNFTAYVGRSRFTQYGKCKLSFGKIEEINPPKFGNKIYLRLDSPLIPAQDYFIGAKNILTAEVSDVLNEICGRKIFSIGKLFSAGVEVENFVVTWGMKRPRVQALAAGTIFELVAEKLTCDDLKIIGEKIYNGFGTRLEEGFGQLRIWTAEKLTLGELPPIKIDKPEKFSDLTKKIAAKILLEKILEQVRLYAHEDAEKLRPQLSRGSYTHFFSRLDAILSSVGKSNVCENFKAQLEIEIRVGSLFDDNLKKIRMANGQSHFNALKDKSALPIKSRDLKKDLVGDSSKLINLFKDISFDEKIFDDAICFEYLQNYFRFARKIASSVKVGDAND